MCLGYLQGSESISEEQEDTCPHADPGGLEVRGMSAIKGRSVPEESKKGNELVNQGPTDM